MPSNKREGILVGLMMCFGMVFVMTFYNMATSGMIGHMTFGAVVMSFVSGFAVAFILDLFIVAYPLQLLVMEPLVRLLFVKFVKGEDQPMANGEALAEWGLSWCMCIWLESKRWEESPPSFI